MLSLWEKMEAALSLLKKFLGIGLQNLPYPHLCVPNSTHLEYLQLEGRKRAFMSRAFCSGMELWISRMDFKCTLLQTEWILTPIRCHLLWSKGYYRLSGLWFCCTHALPCCAGACDHGGEKGFWFRDGKSFPGSPGLFSLHIFFESDFG